MHRWLAGLVVVLLSGCSDNNPAPDTRVPDGVPGGELRPGDGPAGERGTADGPRSDLPPTPTKWVLVPGATQPLLEDSASALLLNGDVLIATGSRAQSTGGTGWETIYVSECYRYIYKSNSFEAAGKVAVARAYPTATRLKDGRVLVAGGESDLAYGDPAVDIYDPEKKTWSAGPAMPLGREGHAALLLGDNVLVIAGEHGDTTLDSLVQYEPATNTWKQLAPLLKQKRTFHTATLLKNGKVLITGGSQGPNKARVFLDSMEIYDPGTGNSTLLTAKLSSKKASHTADLLPDGRVLLLGGWCGSCTATEWKNLADIYDPVTDKVTSIAAHGDESPHLHAHTLMADGRVLIAGGTSHPEQALVFAPAGGGAWLALPNLIKPRESADAFTLPDGSILLAGGHTSDSSGNIPTFPPAERFVP